MLAYTWLAPVIRALTNTNVVVSFCTTNSTPLNLGFAGFTTELLGKGEEYADTNLQHYAAMLSPGWLLFPGGSTGDAFDWQTGLTRTDWVSTVMAEEGPNNSAGSLTANTVLALQGKGGAWLTNFAAMADNLGGAKIIVCINGFTDTNWNDAGLFAGYALSNHIQVAAWELCNEPYLFQGTNDFFTNGTDYCNKMLPFRNAIKAADSNAMVALFFSDPARPGTSWDKDLARYGVTNQYWDSVVYHYYPNFPTNLSFPELMVMDNGNLYSNSTSYVSNTLIQDSCNTTTFLLTEFAPGSATSNGSESLPTSTLYGGVYAAEMVLRLSICPQMIFAGSYQLLEGAGVDTTNDCWNAVTKAATNGVVTNTVGLPFGYFLSAQGSAEGVAYWALNRSTAVYATSVGTNCPTVPMDLSGTPTMPAVYAQAYQGGNGKRYVVLTNKGSNAVPVQITQDGASLTNQFLETYVTGTDPTVVNSNQTTTSNIVILTATVTNAVSIPEYSVVRLEWTVSNVPPPVLAMTASSTTQNLRWAGQTNVVYNVQASTNLSSGWTTIDRIANTQTNYGFTNWNAGSQQFYRLAVP
ncbi:MAG: hypothetical protein ABSH48_28150 [Verrucomicrobiota bacterium]